MLVSPHAQSLSSGSGAFLAQWSVCWWLQSVPDRIIFHPLGADFNTIAELALLVSSLSWEFCQMSLKAVNSTFLVSTIMVCPPSQALLTSP